MTWSVTGSRSKCDDSFGGGVSDHEKKTKSRVNNMNKETKNMVGSISVDDE